MFWILALLLVVAAMAALTVIALRNRAELEPSRARLKVLRIEAERGIVVIGNLGLAPARDVTASLLEDGESLGSGSWSTLGHGDVVTFRPAGAERAIQLAKEIEFAVHLEWLDLDEQVRSIEETAPLVLR